MPVGTSGAMKGMHWREVRDAGADIVLGNTYHLMLRPGAERIAALGGLQTFTGWNGPMLTDSGGFQVMSLAQLRKLSERAVTFRSHIDGTSYELSPERSIEVQRLLGSDIAMQLDECVRLPAERGDIERAMQLSLRWGERSKRAFETRRIGYHAVRHRAGRRRSGASPGQRARNGRYRLSRLRHRRPRGGRTAGGDARDDRGGRADPALGPAALSDGRRHPGRYSGSGGARHRHVRLRDADPERAPRHGVHAVRSGQSAAMRGTPTIRVRSTKKAHGRPHAPMRGPICTIS